MLLLTGTSDKIRVVTGSAGDVDISVSYVDIDPAADPIIPDPGRGLFSVTTATTTDVVGSPTGTVQRNVQTIVIRNVHASISNLITVRQTDGTTTIDNMAATLGPSEAMQFLDGVGWQVLTNSGAVKTSQNQGNVPSGGSQSVAVLGADVTNNNATANTIASVTGLSFPVTSGKKYRFRFEFQYTAAATTTGSRWSISGPGGTMRYRSEYSLTSTTKTTNEGLTAHDTPSGASASSAATAGNCGTVEGFYEASATGDVILRFASEISSSAIVCKAGSVVYYQEVL